MIAATVALALPIAACWLVLRALRLHERQHPLLTAALAVCGGVGLSSLFTFWWVLSGTRLANRFAAADAAVWGALAVAAWLARRRLPPGIRSAGPAAGRETGLLVAARVAFALLAVIASATVVEHYLAAPHGHWDAWAIWNQKARFLVRDIAHWKDMQAIGWSNPSHPFLVSLSVARLWAYGGSETTLAPALLSGLWAAAIVAAVIGGLGPERWQSWVAGAVVVAPVMFTELGAAQTADLPTALFIVATVGVVFTVAGGAGAKRGPLVAAAMLATLAAWTKNEGLLFAAVMTVVVGAWSAWHARPAAAAWWAVGLVPVGIAVVWFKLVVAPLPPEYLTESEGGGALARFFVVERHALVIETAWPLFWGWGGTFASGLLPLGVVAAVVSAVRRPAARPLLAALVLMLGGYYAVWVVSALDTAWLVRTTFDRLLMQIWPALVFIAFAPEP